MAVAIDRRFFLKQEYLYLYFSGSTFSTESLDGISHLQPTSNLHVSVASIISHTRGRVGGQLVGPFNPLSL